MNHARQRSTGAARRLSIRIPSVQTGTRDGPGKLSLVPRQERRVQHVARLFRGTRFLISELIWLPQVNEGEQGDKGEAKGCAALRPCSTPATTAAQGRRCTLLRFGNETERGRQKGRFVERLN